MKKFTLFIISITLILISNSCEKIININLNEANQQTVIEAIITDSLGYNYVKISKTRSLYEDNNFEKVKNAQVEIIEDEINTIILSEIEDGYYSNPNFRGNQNSKYELKISTENQVFTSTSIMPEITKIDSVNFYIFESEFTGELIFIANMFYTDTILEGNYYRIKTYHNGEVGEEDGFNIFSDDYINGTMSAFSYFSEDLFFGDEVVFHLFSTDKANYEYWRLLFMNPSMGMSSTPGNPTSNIEGEDVIGYFGAYSLSIDTLRIVPPESF